MNDLDIDGVDCCIPIQVWLKRRKLAKDMRDRLQERPREAVEIVMGLVAQAKRQAEADGTPPILGMWAIYEDDHGAVPMAIASLRLGPMDASASPERFAGDLIDMFPRRQSQVVAQLETKSGPAQHLVVVIPGGEEAAGQWQHLNLVYWLRPELGKLLVLSATTLDQERAAALSSRVEQLASGVRGF